MSLSFTTIGALASGIPNKYGNRQDYATIADGSKPITAMRQAVDEITETYEFEELKYCTPVPSATPLNMTAAQPIIPISTLLATIPTNTFYPQFATQNIVDLTDIYTFWMWFTGGVNQAGRIIKYRRVPVIDEDGYGITSNTQGAQGVAPPVYFTRFGSNLQVSPAPDQNYQYFVRMKVRHPFPIVNPFTPAIFAPTVVGGQITAVSVVSGGSGYYSSPSNIPMTINTPTGGTAAVAYATGGGGIVTGVTVVSGGSNYTQGNVTTCATAMIASQSVFVPSTWHEILQYRACWALAINSGEQEYVVMFDAMLKSKGVDIEEARRIKSQMKRDERHNERALSLRLGAPYTFA